MTRTIKAMWVFFVVGIMVSCIVSITSAVTLATERVGFVDLERVFDQYPKTTEARKEVDTKRAILKENISAKEDEITVLKDEFDVMVASIAVYTDMQKQAQGQAAAPAKQPTVTMTFSAGISSTGTAMSSSVVESTAPFFSNTLPPISVVKSTTTPTMNPSEIAQRLDVCTKRKAEFENAMQEKRDALESYRETYEKEIKKLEEAYSYNLLGDMYDLICEIAKEQGCVVVFDKSSILYGEPIGDLTNVVIEKLKDKN